MTTTLFLALYLGLAGTTPAAPNENPLQISDEMKQFLDARINRSTDALTKLNTLVRVVFHENALNFTYVSQTRTAIETYNQRSGNCVSFTFLLIGMARYLGLDARFHEVDVAPIWSKVGDILSISGHANVAVYIGSQGYVVDLFPRVDRIQLGGRVVADERAIAHYYSNKAVDLLAAGRPKEALIDFKIALEYDPTAAFVWANLGVAHMMSRDPAAAEKSYLKALQVHPAEMVAMSNLSALYHSLGRERESKAYASKVRRFKQKNPYYHYGLGMEAYNAADYRQAIDHFKAALKLKPVEHNFDLAMAKAYAQLGNMNKTETYLKLAAKNAPDELSKLHYNEKLAILAARQPHS